MTAPTVVTLSDEQAEQEAYAFLEPLMHDDWSFSEQRRLLAAIFQRVYQEGIVAGMDRAIATVKAGHR